MTQVIEKEQLVETIRLYLPELLESDQQFRYEIEQLLSRHFMNRHESDRRFDRLMDEWRSEREEQSRQWDLKWEEQNSKWEEQNRKWEEQNRKWDEQNRKWDEQNRKWDEQNRKWELKWEEHRREFDRVHEEIMAISQKHDRSIGALGSRWGLQSERAFRDALAAILEQSFGVQVINVNEFDDEGSVFGAPDQVEIDVIIKNGLLIICELKSSIDKAGMYIFHRKTLFYEQRHNRTANRKIVISPMIDTRARAVGERLGIEMYGDSLDVVA
ncbi:DUF3782 domain-containing protein [Ectothiorhodospiraceae bacterium BW-2]|nr:DUF3782 domain-containing protein [Ectothiorhodospiraceae bacterium BW-2]